MSVDRLKERITQIAVRLPLVRGRGEEATKQALVLPMLDALGYDIWNPAEVSPEFEADFATKKQGQREKVDLAVLVDGQPRMFLEVKSVDTLLDGHEGQLARYFNAVPAVSLGVLTNGAEYRFYTDTLQPNVMDPTPFYTVRVDGTDVAQDVLVRFHRSAFSPASIRDFASELIYTARIGRFLKNELDLRQRDPSDALVRWILSTEQLYEGRLVSGVIDHFRPYIKNALNQVIRDIVHRSFAAVSEQIASPEPTVEASPSPVTPASPAQPSAHSQDENAEPRSKVVTTDRELAVWEVISALFSAADLQATSLWDASSKRLVPVELGYKDTSGYLGIYLNKPAWWVIRFVDGKQPWIGFNAPADKIAALLPPGRDMLAPHPHAEVRAGLTNPEDLRQFAPALLVAFRHAISERQPPEGRTP